MKKYKIKILQEAFEDLEEIILYVSKDSKENALKLHNEIMESINKLSKLPKRGRLVPEKNMTRLGFRMLFVSSYIIFYRIIGEEVYIYRVLHGKQNYPILFNGK